MGSLLLITVAFAGLFMDYYTTAIGAVDNYGPPGLFLSLVVQAVQLFSMVWIRTKSDSDTIGFRLALAMMVVSTAINTYFNFLALGGGHLRMPDEVIYALVLLAISFAITTEFESYVSFAIANRSILTLSAAGLPVYVAFPAMIYRIFRGAIANDNHESADGSPSDILLAFSVPLGVVAISMIRALDIYSTYRSIFDVLYIEWWLAIYASLLCSSSQLRAVMMLMSRVRPDWVETIRLFSLSAVNLFGSIAFMSVWTDVTALIVPLSVFLSFAPELFESSLVYRLLALTNRPLRVTESNLPQIVLHAIPRLLDLLESGSRALFRPVRAMVHITVQALGMVWDSASRAVSSAQSIEAQNPGSGRVPEGRPSSGGTVSGIFQRQ